MIINILICMHLISTYKIDDVICLATTQTQQDMHGLLSCKECHYEKAVDKFSSTGIPRCT